MPKLLIEWGGIMAIKTRDYSLTIALGEIIDDKMEKKPQNPAEHPYQWRDWFRKGMIIL